jgi:hypothetical protein
MTPMDWLAIFIVTSPAWMVLTLITVMICDKDFF